MTDVTEDSEAYEWPYARQEWFRMSVQYWPGLRESGETRSYGPGEAVIPAGRPPDCIQVIEDGCVQVTAQARRGEDAFLRDCGEGDILGEELLLPRWERPDGRVISATALTQCTTLAVSREAFLDCLDGRQQLWEGLVRDLTARIAEAEERIVRLARDRPDERLAWLLVRYARSGTATVGEADGSPGLTVSLSIDDLALRTAAASRTVKDALKGLRSRGATAREHGKLVIRNMGILVSRAGMAG